MDMLIMNHPISLGVRHRGEFKLISLKKNTSWCDLQSQICSQWNELRNKDFGCVCCVGSLPRISLSSDVDVDNVMILCHNTSLYVIYADVSIYSPDSTQLVADDIQNCINSERAASVGQLLEVVNRNDNLLTDGEYEEFGANTSIPSYDICPILEKKTLLSDLWGNLVEGGVGQVFHGGAKDFRVQLIKYAARKGFLFDYRRNDAKYIHAVCDSPDSFKCEWFVKAKCLPVTAEFQIYKMNPVHKCVGAVCKNEAKRLRPNIIGSFFLDNVRNKPNMGGTDAKNDMLHSYGFKIPYWKAWRSVENAKENVWGSYDDSYDQLRWYCSAVMSTNPGSIVAIEDDPKSHRFERLFIAFKSCIDGFKSCRPMLFVDGTFMKGRAKGTLLAATAKDGNNGLFPVAIAVVSAENTKNWTWFLTMLRDNVMHDKQILYISDRNLGLMAAFPLVFNEPVHFFCLFHLLTNLKGRFSSGRCTTRRSTLGTLFTQCAYAPTKDLFEVKLAAFKDVGGSMAEEWLTNLPYEKWAVSYSPYISRYGEMTSNAIESFNRWISEARSLPITHMIDHIRKGINRWILKRRENSATWSGALCPKMEELWQVLLDKGRSWTVVRCTAGDFEVYSKPSVRVDLKSRVCSCSKWQISGFPCAHAFAVIHRTCESVFSHVSECFFVSTYRECYMHHIHPIPETYRLEVGSSSDKVILPPNLKRPPGRPKMSRDQSYGEFNKKKRKSKNKDV